jgi:hypothetical protein
MHDNYDKFYTWSGGTLVLDPGVFAYDEPTLEMCQREPVHATALDRIVDPDQQRFCAKPMEFMSPVHAPMPIETAQNCDTIIPGRSYCCPPYVMPNDWRVDYLPLGNDAEAEAQAASAEAVRTVVRETFTQRDMAPEEVQLRAWVRMHPYATIGLSVLAGMVLGRMLGK